MRCDGCSQRKPTRFVIFGKAVGMVVASTWEVRPADLCEPCLHKRYRDWTGLTAVCGWWGVHSFGHALRYIPGNVLEYRRAMRTQPLPVEPSVEEVRDATVLRTRQLLLHRAGNSIFYGGAGVLVGVLFLGMLVAWRAAEWNSGRTIMLLVGIVAALVGGLFVLSGIRRRQAISTRPDEEILALAEQEAPPPRTLRAAEPDRADERAPKGAAPRVAPRPRRRR